MDAVWELSYLKARDPNSNEHGLKGELQQQRVQEGLCVLVV